MAARPGEENVATLFADIHYFYSPPGTNPPHHRFDKGSYVYLFENANERRCRIEIANQPGTEDQDAFDGFLDQSHVRYSYKQHCMVSLTVADAVNQDEWHLPTFDPRNENKYHYKLHALDIYFWTQQDALQFVNGVRRVLPQSRVEVLDEPGPPQHQPAGMSNVVQKLENAAISDPQYRSGSGSGGRTSQGAVSQGGGSGGSGFAPPPPPPIAPHGIPSPPQQQQPPPVNVAPMAYNPAAPPAPEELRHREKTPPPDEDPLNPLAVAVAYDYQKQPFTPGMPPPSQFPPGAVNSPGMPPQGLTSPGFPPSGATGPHFGGPPSHAALQRAATMPAPHSGMASPGLMSPYGSAFPGSPGMPPPPPPPMQSQQAHPQPPAQQPTPPVTSPGLPPQHQQQQHHSGFSNYTYTQQQQQQQQQHQQQPSQSGSVDYSIHSQGYMPTEAEAMGKTPQQQQQQQQQQDPRGRLEENAGRLERGMTGMLKKFEKKFG